MLKGVLEALDGYDTNRNQAALSPETSNQLSAPTNTRVQALTLILGWVARNLARIQNNQDRDLFHTSIVGVKAQQLRYSQKQQVDSRQSTYYYQRTIRRARISCPERVKALLKPAHIVALRALKSSRKDSYLKEPTPSRGLTYSTMS